MALNSLPTAWFEHFEKIVFNYRFQNHKQIILYFINIRSNKISNLVIYVDGIILIHDDETSLTDLKKIKIYACTFQMKDLGTLKYFLGMKFARLRKDIFNLLIKGSMFLTDLKNQTGCRIAETLLNHLKLKVTKLKK